MNDITQVRNCIREEIRNVEPSKKLFFSYLFSLRLYKEGLEFNPKDEWWHLSDAEFFDIVGETFEENPEFYMKKLYKGVRKRMHKLYGIDKLKEMDKYICKKFCLYDDEQIFFEYDGAITYCDNPILKFWGVTIYGTIYVSNYKIIGQGTIRSKEREFSTSRHAKKKIEDFSLQQKCYGYVFPIKNLSNLTKKSKGVSYKVEIYNHTKIIRIFSKSLKLEEDKNKLFEFLSNNA